MVLLEQAIPGELRYAIDAELKGIVWSVTVRNLCRRAGCVNPPPETAAYLIPVPHSDFYSGLKTIMTTQSGNATKNRRRPAYACGLRRPA